MNNLKRSQKLEKKIDVLFDLHTYNCHKSEIVEQEKKFDWGSGSFACKNCNTLHRITHMMIVTKNFDFVKCNYCGHTYKWIGEELE